MTYLYSHTNLVLIWVNINGNICNRAVRNCCLCCRDCCCGWYSQRRRSSEAVGEGFPPVDGDGLVWSWSISVVEVATVAMRIHTVHVQAQISYSDGGGDVNKGVSAEAIEVIGSPTPFLFCQSSFRRTAAKLLSPASTTVATPLSSPTLALLLLLLLLLYTIKSSCNERRPASDTWQSVITKKY